MLLLLLSLTLVTPSPVSAYRAPQAQASAPAPAPQAPADPVAATQAPDKSAYVIGPQDVLKITVFEEPTLSNTFKVGTDGSFDFPYISRVIAAGKTPRDLEVEITRKLADGYVKKPQITVEVEQYRSRSFFVSGEVRSPNKYTLTGQMTLIEALVQAGFFTANAGTYLLVTRSSDVGSATTGPQQIRIGIADIQAGLPEANIQLREGDSIFVPKAEKFYVTGFVKSPGAYTHETGMTVLQALSLAGGVNEKGSTRGIKVKRKVPGKVKVKDAAGKEIEVDGQVEREIGVDMSDQIQPGDTLVVRQRLL